MNKKVKVIITILMISITFTPIIFYGYQKYEIKKYKTLNLENDKNNAYVHFSIDDCINIFYDLDKNQDKYKSIFENKLLKYLKHLNSEYGCKFSLYVFENNDSFDISNCTSKYKEEFEQNSSWLKFGFHALNSKSDYSNDNIQIVEDYNLVIENLKRIVGEKSITNIFRLEKFLLNEKNAKILKDGIKDFSLLGADTENREDYYLNEEQNTKLFKNEYYYDEDNKIEIYNTDFRLENISSKNINKMLFEMNDKNLIIFTHEWIFDSFKNSITTKYKIEKICKYAIEHGYSFDYPYKN